MAALRLTETPQHLLRVGCRRCRRTVEIQKVDAIRLYGRRAIWKDVGQRLLDDTCTGLSDAAPDDMGLCRKARLRGGAVLSGADRGFETDYEHFKNVLRRKSTHRVQSPAPT